MRLEVTAGEPVATVHTAAAEVGQGLITVEQQICRTELGVDRVVRAPQGHPRRLGRLDVGVPADLRDRRRGQGRLRGGPRPGAGRAPPRPGRPAASLRLDGGKVVADTGEVVRLADVLGASAVEETVEWRHRPTEPIDPETGQGNAHVQYAFSAHRAVVDVDVELGLVKVVALDTRPGRRPGDQPPGRGRQIQGGSTQGMGLALMEEIVVTRRA